MRATADKSSAAQRLPRPYRELGGNGFLELPHHYDYKDSRVVVVPFGLEKTVTYERGTAKGPKAIIKASKLVEFFDEDLGYEPYRDYGIATIAPFSIARSHQAALRQISRLTTQLLRQHKFPLTLGGEHSLLIGTLEGTSAAMGQKMNVLQFDSHSDLRTSYDQKPLSHAAAMYRSLPYIHRYVQVGIRHTATDEHRRVLADVAKRRLKFYSAEDIVEGDQQAIARTIATFLHGRPVYLTFDVDAFDPAYIGSSTGTPEPGGLGWYDILRLLRIVVPRLNIVAADFVELLPRQDQHAPDFTIAKLIYKFLNLHFHQQASARLRRR